MNSVFITIHSIFHILLLNKSQELQKYVHTRLFNDLQLPHSTQVPDFSEGP